MPRPETHGYITPLEAAVTAEIQAGAPRFHWRVRDCVFCSWRQLRDQYSVAEMWQLLRQGRFTKAVRIETRER
jgi:hypothetical protein